MSWQIPPPLTMFLGRGTVDEDYSLRLGME